MVYQPDDPDLGEPHTLKLITKNASYIPIFEALRNNAPSSIPLSPTRSQQSVPPPRTPLSLHQQVVLPPTDEECGLPDLYTTTLSAIPKSHLSLSKYLSRSPVAAVLHGYTRSELAVSLAHALNIRRCHTESRAVLIVAASEAAAREWVAAMCPVLDEIQLISFSRARLKRDATLVRLRETQFPGVVVAAEKAAREGMQELWAALRENRLIRKWDFVVSDAVSDANVESVCSPLRMVRDGMTACGVVLGKKALSRTRATAVVRGLEQLVMDSFWVRKKDLPDLVERIETREEGAGEKVRHTPDGKENRALLRNRDISGVDNGMNQERQTSQGPVTVRRRSSSGVVKPAKGKEPSLRSTTRLPRAVLSNAQRFADDVDKLASGTDSSTDLRRSSRNPVRIASGGVESGDAKADDTHGERTGRAPKGPIKRRKPYNRIAPELLSQGQRPRRRSPRFSPPPSNESSLAPQSKPQPKQRQSTKSESIQKPVPVLPVKAKRADSRSRGSSSGSVALSRTEMTNEDDGNTTSSRIIRDKVQTRARALGIYDTSSGEDTFYTPPTRPMLPKSSSPSPDKYHTPRTSFSPKVVTDSSKSRGNSLLKIASNKGSSSRSHERERAKSASTRYISPKAKAAPLKIDGSGTNTRLNFGDSDSSDDESLSTKLADRRRDGGRRRAKTYISPALTRKKTAVQTDSEAQERNQTTKRRSVFERLAIPKFPPSNKSTGVSRRHSFSGPVRVKHENDVGSEERPPGIPRYSYVEAKNRRKSFHYTMKREDNIFNRDDKMPERTPQYSNVGKQKRRSSLPSTGSILPLKRPSLENSRTYSAPRNVQQSTSNASRARRASLNELRRRTTTPRPSLENRKTYSAPRNVQQTTSNASRARRASLDELRRRTATPTYKGQNRELTSNPNRIRSEVGAQSRSPLRTTVPDASPVPLEVIIISDSEEETFHDVTPTKKRRVIPTAEPRGTGRNETITGTSSGGIQDRVAGPRRAIRRNNARVGASSQMIHGQDDESSRGTRRNDTGARTSDQRIHGKNVEARRGTRRNDAGAGPSSRGSQGQNRTEPSNSQQVRSLRSSRETVVPRDEDLGAFIRNISRRRHLSGLTDFQRKKYDDHLKIAKRYQRMSRLKEAIESYQECLDIYDGDPELTNRILALSSQQGYLFPTDFAPQPTRSPIKKQPRHRRNPGRTARAERSSSRLEVIDLTSS